VIFLLNDIISKLRGERKIVAVAASNDPHVMESVAAAKDLGIADFILFDGNGCDKEACRQAVALVAAGKAHAIMKGLTETSTIMKAALDKEHGIRGTRRLSHLAMFILPKEFYHKPLYVTDAAVNISPDFDLKKEIIENAVSAVRSLGIEKPKVALIAAKEKSDPKMPVTVEYDALVGLHMKGWLPDAFIQGPLSLDGAVSKESCEIKGITGDVAGDADILFCPYIEAGNVLYKSLTMFTKAQLGGVILGAKAPIILTSRSDSAENKLLSIALGSLIKGD